MLTYTHEQFSIIFDVIVLRIVLHHTQQQAWRIPVKVAGFYAARLQALRARFGLQFTWSIDARVVLTAGPVKFHAGIEGLSEPKNDDRNKEKPRIPQ